MKLFRKIFSRKKSEDPPPPVEVPDPPLPQEGPGESLVRTLRIVPLNPRGHTPISEEHWKEHRGSLLGVESETKVTCADGTLAPPEAIRGWCAVCGLPATELKRSELSGQVLCLIHVRTVSVEQGKTITCSEAELRQLLRDQNLWNQYDEGQLRPHLPHPENHEES